MKIKNILLAIISVASTIVHAESICSETQMEDLVKSSSTAVWGNNSNLV
ncbi:MAG: hypothetical protein IPM97_12455 [Bdellovibrionaceae bacterium]|nr:hypothetical protein [Pseudobdellovibrionaceae bacterium]